MDEKEPESKVHPEMRSEKKTETRNSIIRLIFVLLAITLQIWWFYFIIDRLAGVSSPVDQLIRVLAILFALYVYGQHKCRAQDADDHPEVTQKARGRRSIPKRVFQCLLRLFASLE